MRCDKGGNSQPVASLKCFSAPATPPPTPLDIQDAKDKRNQRLARIPRCWGGGGIGWHPSLHPQPWLPLALIERIPRHHASPALSGVAPGGYQAGSAEKGRGWLRRGREGRLPHLPAALAHPPPEVDQRELERRTWDGSRLQHEWRWPSAPDI